MKPTIVIPTYWRGPVEDDPYCGTEEDFKFDHATPLDGEGTLERALESLSVFAPGQEFNVAVVAAPTRPEIKQAVELKVRSITARYDFRFPFFFIGPDELVSWRRRLAAAGYPQFDELLSLDGYSNVRNMCLLAAVLTGADVAILFDDDQIYEDPDYLKKALEFIGGEHDGRPVSGIAGTYIQESGDPYLPPSKTGWEQEWGKHEAMNDTLRLMLNTPRLKETPVVFGGNMVIHRSLFEKIPFDPSVPRGEDMDYLINARFFGHHFFADNQLVVTHLPPPKCAPLWQRLRQDIVRFARERAKLATQRPGEGLHRVDATALDPYPGRFLKDDYHDLVLKTSLEMASEYLETGLDDDAQECMTNIAISKAEAEIHGDPFGEYLAYQQKWEEFIRVLPQIGLWTVGGKGQ